MQPSFITNATQYKFCDMPIVKDREFCYHQPPMEMSLKLVGMCVMISPVLLLHQIWFVMVQRYISAADQLSVFVHTERLNNIKLNFVCTM